MTLYYLVIILSSVVYVDALVLPQNHVSSPSNNPAMESQLLIQTSAVLKVSYDGGHFFGWKATNDGMPISEEASDAVDWGSIPLYNKKRSRRNTRNKTVPKKPVVVRSVVGVLKKALAKIYGDVDSSRIQVEGSSRTDRGVHAHGMIAFVYCLTIDAVPEAGSDSENHDWRHRRVPETPHDSSHFLPLPFQGNMDKMVFVLNRMLPRDVCIMDVSTLPHVNNPITTHYIAPHLFHPSIDAISKTYQYTVSIGNMHDPLRCR
jgi:tRNA U38,U39,U40 pseudouridine synthase TruA